MTIARRKSFPKPIQCFFDKVMYKLGYVSDVVFIPKVTPQEMNREQLQKNMIKSLRVSPIYIDINTDISKNDITHNQLMERYYEEIKTALNTTSSVYCVFINSKYTRPREEIDVAQDLENKLRMMTCTKNLEDIF